LQPFAEFTFIPIFPLYKPTYSTITIFKSRVQSILSTWHINSNLYRTIHFKKCVKQIQTRFILVSHWGYKVAFGKILH